MHFLKLLFTFGCLIVLAYLSLNPYPVLLNHWLNPDYDRHLTDYSRSMSSALVAFLIDYLAVVVSVLSLTMLLVVALAMAPSACPWAFS